ncbi:SPASM domain-containing protein, partial [Patescibacteria group bacterium]|nr:SPASM domain-containing protein [Patescibacteria group bacterium]
EENNYIRRGGDFIKNSNQIKRLVEKKKKCGSKLKIYISNVIFPKKNKILNVDSPEYLIKTFSKYNEDITIRSFHAIYWPGFPLSVDFGEPIRNNCDHIENVITIRWNGDVVPCCYDLISKKILGNILNESIEDIWNGKEIIDFRRKIKIKEPPEICKGCNLLYTEKYIYEGIIK